jgi:2-polyprenyl-3-methyl-5-hydroxy-6-metoxy-1,4-benzoquinol methylase
MKEKLQQLKNSVDEFLSDGKILNASELRLILISAADGLHELCQFDDLKTLLNSSEWPDAVFKVQIADENSEDDKKERAEGIADVILPSLDQKKFLDFGCGEGHVAKYAAKNANLSIGYETEKNPSSQLEWEEKKENLLLTTDFEKVKAEGPYDIILIYDVLDHAKGESMTQVLEKAKSVLSDEGNIYLRCHPWASRHGGHAYRKINKAFVHLVLSEEELKEMELELEFNNKVLYPLATYLKAIEDAGLAKVNEEEIDFQDVEPFFSENAVVKERLLKLYGIREWGDSGRPAFQMSQCFVDYVLKKQTPPTPINNDLPVL